jgi:hypothetical protein
MKRKLLPIGIQDFRKLRTKNCVYVDKTEYIHRLVTEGWYYFLSRPRRFGKSLLVSTLKELFSGSRELFEGLWIEDKWDWSKTNPVIQISFAKADYQGKGLEKAIDEELDNCAKSHKIILESDTNKGKLTELLLKLNDNHGKVVILIDEYDKPIIDYLEYEKLPKAREHRDILKTFYSVLKDSDTYLEFLLITGVSKFSQVSIFSDLNHLDDITLDKHYALLTGYTHSELETYFPDYLESVAKHLGMSVPDLLKLMAVWYNGFSWDGKNKVYNPFGTLNFFKNQTFRNYWFTTGTPTFLAQIMQQQIKFDFENIHTSTSRIEKYDLDNLDIVSLLFQTGYLTITHLDPFNGDIVLDYPNREIRESMYVFMLDYLKKRKSEGSAQEIVKDLALAFHQDDLERVKELLESMFGDLPSNLYETDNKRSERFYHSFIHLTFKYLGIYAQSEVRTAKGRADSVVETPTHVYIFEFKHQETADAAFQQILDKNYAQKYVGLGKTVVGIGVNFDKKERIIDGWKVEVLK